MPILEARNISYAYEKELKSSPILADVNLKVAAGEMVSITGPSGSGKSTLLYLLSGMLQNQQGEIYIDGLNIGTLSKDQLVILRSQKLGFIFQDACLLPRANVLDNILLPVTYPSEFITLKKPYREKAIVYAKRLGLDHRLNHFPNELSRGEQQRVAIARALIKGVKIIFADEPTGSLDYERSSRIIDYLVKLKEEEGLTVLLVTHDRGIAKCADRVFTLKRGSLLISSQNKQKKSEHGCLYPGYTSKKEKAKNNNRKICKVGRISGIFNTIFKLLPVAAKNIFRNRTRSILTMSGIVIGIAAMLTMLTLGQFTKKKILATYTTLGADTLGIYGYKTTHYHGGNGVLRFDSFDIDDDVKPLLKIFPQITKASPVLYNSNINLTYANQKIAREVSMFGVSKDYLDIADKKVQEGRDFINWDFEKPIGICIIGSDIADKLSDETEVIGATINLEVGKNYFPCSVIGVLAKSNLGRSGIYNQNEQIITPYNFYLDVIRDPWNSKVKNILIEVSDAKSIQEVGGAIKEYFTAKYGLTGNFTVDRNVVLLAQMRKFFNLFTLMLAVISLIALTIGGIGITNMMLISVAEQLKEIGLRKALGATDRSIRIQFLIRSIVICAIGGVLGLLIGFILYQSIIYGATKFVPALRFEWILSPFAIVLSFLSIFIVGVLSGMVPARKAESLDVVTALRSE